MKESERDRGEQRITYVPEAEKLVMECARELCGMQADEMDCAIQRVLEKMGFFWEAGCVYLFQTEEPEAGIIHEWRSGALSWKERIHAYMPFFQQHWDEYFLSNSFVEIQDAGEIRTSRPEAYRMLEELDIHSVFVLPLRMGNQLMGFLGMENYDTDKIPNMHGVLGFITYFVAFALRISSMARRLEQ